MRGGGRLEPDAPLAGFVGYVNCVLSRGCRGESRGIFFFRYAGAFCRIGHQPDLFQLRFLKPKERGHLNDLGRAYEIIWVGAELFHARSKLAATHSFWNIETESALAVCPVL